MKRTISRLPALRGPGIHDQKVNILKQKIDKKKKKKKIDGIFESGRDFLSKIH